jgi:hypothetical protein
MDIWGLVDQTYTTVLFVRTLTVDTVGHIEIQSHESDVWQRLPQYDIFVLTIELLILIPQYGAGALEKSVFL